MRSPKQVVHIGGVEVEVRLVDGLDSRWGPDAQARALEAARKTVLEEMVGKLRKGKRLLLTMSPLPGTKFNVDCEWLD